MKSKSVFYGMNPPFIGGPQNILSRQEDDQLIKNDILQLLTTEPGERVMRPTYGVRLRSFVFEQSTKGDISALQSDIAQAISDYEPRVVVEEVQMSPDADRNGLGIKVIVRLKRDMKRLITVEHFLARGA